MSPTSMFNDSYHGCFGFGRYEDAHDDHDAIFEPVHHGNKRKEGNNVQGGISNSKSGQRVNTKAKRIVVG